MDIMRRRLMLTPPQDENLFNVFAPFANPSDTTLSNTTKRIFTPGTHCIGASYSNYFAPNYVTNFEVSPDGSMTISCSTGYGVGYAFKVAVGERYILNCTRINAVINRIIYASDGTPLTNDSEVVNNDIPIINENADILVIIFRSSVTANPAVYSDITLRKETT